MSHNIFLKSYNKRKYENFAQGLTLIELVIALAVLGILVALAAPSFRDFLMTSNAKSIANELVGDLNFARAEAVKQGVNVGVVANNGLWDAGWQVGVVNANGTLATPLLRTQSPPLQGYTVVGRIGAASALRIEFNGRGSRAVPTVVGDTLFRVCRPDNDVSKARLITVTAQGQVSATRNTSGTCP